MMSRRIAALAWVFLVVACSHTPPPYVSTYTAPTTAPIAPLMPVAMIGDSYTSGTSLGGKGVNGWPALVAAQLRAMGVYIEPANGAAKGAGYAEPNSVGLVFADEVPKVVTPDDRLVVLFGSMNDAGDPNLSAAVERTLAEVKLTAPTARLLVIGPPWTGPDPPERILLARDVVKTQTEIAGAVFIDPLAEGWFADRPDLIGSDGVHPTDAGHQYMADKIAPLIAAQLQTPAP